MIGMMVSEAKSTAASSQQGMLSLVEDVPYQAEQAEKWDFI
jgi:hypothetical protein